MCSVVGKPMVQDTPVQDIPIPEQDIVMQEQSLPQTNPEPEMGAAAAVAYETSPLPLRQNPPIRLEQSAVDMILQAINGMKNKMDANMQAFRSDLRALRVKRGKWADACRRA